MYKIVGEYNSAVFAMPPVTVSCFRCGNDIGTITKKVRGRGSVSPYLVRHATGDMIITGIVRCPLCATEIWINVADMMDDVLGMAVLERCQEVGVSVEELHVA